MKPKFATTEVAKNRNFKELYGKLSTFSKMTSLSKWKRLHLSSNVIDSELKDEVLQKERQKVTPNSKNQNNH